MSTNNEIFLSLFSPRLTEERKRLGLSQAKAGQLCGISREVWGKYERGRVAPGSEVLYHFANVGADIGYMFSGQRITGDTEGLRRVEDQDGRYRLAKASAEEVKEAYTQADPMLQVAVCRVLKLE